MHSISAASDYLNAMKIGFDCFKNKEMNFNISDFLDDLFKYFSA